MIHQTLSPGGVDWLTPPPPHPNTPTCILIHGGQFTGGVHPPIQFVPEIVSPLPCLPALVCHTSPIFFFEELISFTSTLDKMPHQHFQCFDFICVLRTLGLFKLRLVWQRIMRSEYVSTLNHQFQQVFSF